MQINKSAWAIIYKLEICCFFDKKKYFYEFLSLFQTHAIKWYINSANLTRTNKLGTFILSRHLPYLFFKKKQKLFCFWMMKSVADAD